MKEGIALGLAASGLPADLGGLELGVASNGALEHNVALDDGVLPVALDHRQGADAGVHPAGEVRQQGAGDLAHDGPCGVLALAADVGEASLVVSDGSWVEPIGTSMSEHSDCGLVMICLASGSRSAAAVPGPSHAAPSSPTWKATQSGNSCTSSCTTR